jgi:hypothetical protein
MLDFDKVPDSYLLGFKVCILGVWFDYYDAVILVPDLATVLLIIAYRVTSYCLVDISQCFGGTSCHHLQSINL